MDDLLALMEEGDGGSVASSEEVPCAPSSSPSQQERIVTPASSERPLTAANNRKKPKKNAAQAVDTQVDHRLGIRMTQRNMGSLDMLDFMASSNYHSPAALAAMSLEGLNQQVLLEPTPVLDVATVCGRTNLLTIGIVFSNSGTKIASSGKAFCILTIGSNLLSGPSVTVLCFGPAYSKYCSSAKPGLVVAVRDPRMIPPKPNDNNKKSSLYDTSISFSINDENQLTIIAKARDYGVCQAMVKGKNAQGNWVSNARRCSTAIDTRVSKYCQLHRKLENVRPNAVNNKSKQDTFIQQQRQDLNTKSFRREGNILPNNRGNQNSIIAATPAPAQAGSGRLQGVPMQMVKGAPAQTQHAPAQRPDSLGCRVPPAPNGHSNNGILNPKSRQAQSNHAPRTDGIASHNNRPAKSSSNRLLNPSLGKSASASVPPSSTQGIAKVCRNPYASKPKSATETEQAARAPVLQNSTNQQLKKRSKPVVHDWLTNPTGKKQKKPFGSSSHKSSSTRSKGNLNTIAMGGFDGQVPVPKPAKIFASKGARPQQTVNSTREEQQHCPREEILAKQQRIAQQAAASQKETLSKSIKKSAKKPIAKSSRSSFFDSIPDAQDFDRETLVNAKSRFATEADAEAYALSRRRVTELEEEEARKESSKKKKEKQQRDNVIGKEWICRTCGKRSSVELRACIRSNHKVKRNRILNKANETKEDKRVKLSNAAVEDGGITLGSGLEWSRFPSSRFS